MRRPRLAFVLALTPLLLGCTTWEREKVGNARIHRRRTTFAGHTASHAKLVYGWRTLASHLGDAAADPRDPDRILFSRARSAGEAARRDEGTFLFDGHTGKLRRVASESYGVGEPGDPRLPQRRSRWSPDGRRVFVDDLWDPLVVDLRSGQAVRVAAVAGVGGSLRAWSWSPSGRRMAVVISNERDMRTDQDLVAIDVETGEVEYVATLAGGATRGTTLWSDGDFRWDGERLVTVGGHGFRRRPSRQLPGIAATARGVHETDVSVALVRARL